MPNLGRYASIPMPHGCLYLNNDGSRWVTQDMRFVLVMPDGKRKVRLADHYESLGNFGLIAYRISGQRYTALPKSWDGSEMTDHEATGNDALPHVFMTTNQMTRGER